MQPGYKSLPISLWSFACISSTVVDHPASSWNITIEQFGDAWWHSMITGETHPLPNILVLKADSNGNKKLTVKA